MIYKYHSKNSPFQRRSITLTIQRVQNRIQEINVYIQSLYLRLCVAASSFSATNVHGNQHRTYLRIYFNKQHFCHASWRKSVLFIITRTACLEVERDAGGVASHQRYSASRRRLRAWRRASLGHVTRPADAHATMITWSIEGQPPSYHRRKPCGLKEKSSNFFQESYQI